MNTREDIFQEAGQICANFNLLPMLKNVQAKNPSNDLPYHNWYHTNCVVVNCAKGARYHRLPFDTTRDLLIAAMWHDFGHSGGKCDDWQNVKYAMECLRDEYYGLYATEKISKFIHCTEYPFIHEPFCIEQEILRDADMMQWIMPDAEEMILKGLKSEVDVRRGPITEVEWLDIQMQFIRKAVFFTEINLTPVIGLSTYMSCLERNDD
jgi:hypothetical protein